MIMGNSAKQRVQEAALALRYRPHDSARGLKLQRTNTIGLVIADITNPFYSELAAGVLSSAKKWGYHVILAAMTGQNERLWRDVVDLGMKVVLIDRKVISLPEADVVQVDNTKGSHAAISYLLSLGHRRIGILCGPVSLMPGQERLTGYCQAYEDAHLVVDRDLIQTVSFKRESGIHGVEQLLALDKPPTALFATNNLIGEMALSALRTKGLRVPKDISLLMFDDVPWASLTTPQITVVAQPISHLGTRAVEQLILRLQNPDEVVREGRAIILPPELILRESCAPPRLSIAARNGQSS